MIYFWFAFFSSLGYILLLNNTIIFTMKDSFKNKMNQMILENPSVINNRLFWNTYKLYVTSKNTIITLYNDWQRNIYKKNLRCNILLITNGIRSEKIICDKGATTLTCDDVLKYKDHTADLILFRTPSPNINVDYDLVRLDSLSNITFSNNNTVEVDENLASTDNENENTSSNNIDDVIKDCNKSIIAIDYENSIHKIYSPTLWVKDTDLTYDLSLKKDNYYITGNTLFDKPFIEWILNEKYGATLNNDKDYEITYFDDNMNQKVIEKNNGVLLEKDKITLLSDIKKDDTQVSSSWIW